MLEVRNFTTGYGKNDVLQDISAVFEKGKLISLIGPNGSGKSTLLKSLAGILPAVSGDISIEGQSVFSMKKQELAKELAYLSQGKAVPDMTARQLVLHGRFPHLDYPRRYTKNDREIALSAMEQTGISELADARLSTLSGGMIQSAYIAMALAQSTDYILLDEPTTYLDVAHQAQLMRTLRQLADSGKGILCVMHDLPLAFTFSDKILVLDKGKIMADGSPGQVFSTGTVSKVFGVELKLSQEGDYFCLLRK